MIGYLCVLKEEEEGGVMNQYNALDRDSLVKIILVHTFLFLSYEHNTRTH